MGNNKKVGSQIMDLKDLISAPLVATIDADTISTRRYLKYLFDLAFESYDTKTGEVGAMRMLTFEYCVSDGGNERKQRVSIPLLTLAPLPLLQVKEANFEFDVNVLDSVVQSSSDILPLSQNTESQKNRKLRVALSPSLSPSATTESTIKQGLSANMKVQIKMEQADLPGGIANLLNYTTNNTLVEEL